MVAWRYRRNVFHDQYVRYLDFVARVGAYRTLLADQFPGFAPPRSGEEMALIATNQVTLTPRGLLTRLALTPLSLVVVSVIQLGQTVLVVTCWPWTLVTGQLPQQVFDAVRAIERFFLRTLAFALMVQSEYPRDLLGERVLEADSLSLIEALEQSPVSAMKHTHRRAREAAPASTTWPVRISTSARKVVLASVAIGVVMSVIIKIEYQVLTRPPHHSQSWSNSHYFQLRSAIDTSAVALTAISAPRPAWSVVAQQCSEVTGAFRFDRHIAPYPDRHQNQDFRQGKALIAAALHDCSLAVSTHDRTWLHHVELPLAHGINELIAFLDEILQPNGE